MRALRPFAVLAIALVAASMGCSQDNPETHAAAGKAFLAKGDHPAAVIEFKNALKGGGESGELRFLLGKSLHSVGELSAAEIELRKAVSIGYDLDNSLLELVSVLNEAGHYQKVLAEAKPEAAGSKLVRAELTALVGEALLRTGKIPESKKAFETAVSVFPGSLGGKIGIARHKAIENDVPSAHKLTDEVLAAAPDRLDALQFKADLLVDEGKGDEAITVYGKAIAARPTAARLYMSLVPILVARKDFKASREWIEKLKKAVPGSIVAVYLDALATYAEGDRGKARDLIRLALKDAPEFAQAQLLAGLIEHDLGKYMQADEHLRKAVEQMPVEVYPRRLLVSTFVRSGQIEKAREALPALLKLADKDAESWFVAGDLAMTLRDTKTAAERFERAAALDPKNALYRARLGMAQLAGGDPNRAIQELEALSAAEPKHYDADLALVGYFLGKREADRALAASEVLKRKQPDNPLSHNLAGLALIAKADWNGARSAFARALELDPSFLAAAQNLSALDVKDKQFAQAEKRFDGVLAKDPRNEEALLALVGIKLHAGADRQAKEAAIDRVINANPGSIRGRLAKIEILLRYNEVKAALVAAQQAQAALPENPIVLAALAKVQLMAGDISQSILSYGKLAALDQKSPLPLIGLADAQIANRDWASAIDALRSAADRDPNAIRAMAGLVKLGIFSGKFEQARADAVAMQKRFPSNALGYLAEVEVLAAQQRLNEAETRLRAAIKSTGAPMLTFRLFGLLNDMKKPAEARAVVQEWMAQHPKDASAPLFAAQYFANRKMFRESIDWYRTALKLKPDDAAILNNIAWTMGEAGDPEALPYVERALAGAPRSPDVLETAGSLYLKNGQNQKAETLLAKAVELAPNNAAIRLSYAKALVASGKRTEATQQLEAITGLPASKEILDAAEKLKK